MLTSKHYTICILLPSIIIQYTYLTVVHYLSGLPEERKWVPIFYYRADSSIL